MGSSVYSRFRMWQEEEVGSSIFSHEVETAEALLERLKPRLVVQVEGKALLESVPEDSYYYHVSEDPQVEARGFSVEAEQGFLPFPDRSVDLLILAHALELYQHPMAVLEECDRVLSERGSILLMSLTSSWLEGNIPSEYHPLGNLKIASIPVRKIKDWVAKAGLVIETEYPLTEEVPFLLSGRLSDMVIHPMGYELKRMEVGWNGMVGVVSE